MIYNVGGGGATSADKIDYDNTDSGLQAENVQDGIDELNSNLAQIGELTYLGEVSTSSQTLSVDFSQYKKVLIIPYNPTDKPVSRPIEYNTELLSSQRTDLNNCSVWTANNNYATQVIKLSINGILGYEVYQALQDFSHAKIYGVK